jgi:hypothetical protein
MSSTNRFAYKGVAFAYPDSPSAKDFGKPDTGCWLVVLFAEYSSIGEDHEAFDSKEDAIAYALNMEQAWHPTYPGYIEQPKGTFPVAPTHP